MPTKLVAHVNDVPKGGARHIEVMQRASDAIAELARNTWPHGEVLGPIPRVWVKHSITEEFIAVRSGMLVEVSLEAPAKMARAGIAHLYRAFLARVPADVLGTGTVDLGANCEDRPWSAAVQEHHEKTFGASSRKSSFEIAVAGPEDYLGAFRFEGHVHRNPPGRGGGHGRAHMFFPESLPWWMGIEEFVAWMNDALGACPGLAWARVGPGLRSERLNHPPIGEARSENPGFLIQSNEVFAALPAAAWLTYLGEAHRTRFESSLRTLSPPTTIEVVGQSLLVRTAPEPELDDLSRVRAVARTLGAG